MDFLIDFEAVLEPPTPGQPPENERAGAVEGGRGEAYIPPPRAQSMSNGFYCWIYYLARAVHARRLSASADFFRTGGDFRYTTILFKTIYD